MNTKLRNNANNDFEKKLFKLMNDVVFGKTMKNSRKHRNTKIASAEARRNFLVKELNCHTRQFFPEYLLAIEVKKDIYS